MRRGLLLLALMGMLFSTAALAAEPSFCTSVCDSERRACKADAQQIAMEDREDLLATQEKNRLARTAANTGAPVRTGARAPVDTALQNRRLGRVAACDTTYQRCERSCRAPEAKATALPIYTPRKSG
ncbi:MULTISPECIES: hypothetical protein [unclassified Massilia]|uniref:hypothetical protein n=1 Tax=unclassified Massilia TaxID=2609279 RepID=UPI00177B6A4F|nr:MULTISPECIES: hypothetical protein [unclassified Massilia]MBD8533103.1 hypothetical protein [Massilia sp. CFBP 13647]MBD8676540.1 hypothetical protein [Massilia sp. CFBP 13721]